MSELTSLINAYVVARQAENFVVNSLQGRGLEPMLEVRLS